MLRKKDIVEIKKLASLDTDMSIRKGNTADVKGSKKNRIYHKIMDIINAHAGKKLRRYEADGAPLVRNNIYANRDLARDAEQAYRGHKLALLKRNLANGTKKGRRLARLFFIGNYYGILQSQENANRYGTKDFELYEQGGYRQAADDFGYIKSVEAGMGYPSPFDLLTDDDLATFKQNVQLGKEKAVQFAEQHETDTVKK